MTGDLWEQVLTRIETKVNRHSFYTWFKPTVFVADRGGELLVRVPNPTFRGLAREALCRPDRRGPDELGEARVVQFVTEVATRAADPERHAG